MLNLVVNQKHGRRPAGDRKRWSQEDIGCGASILEDIWLGSVLISDGSANTIEQIADKFFVCLVPTDLNLVDSHQRVLFFLLIFLSNLFFVDSLITGLDYDGPILASLLKIIWNCLIRFFNYYYPPRNPILLVLGLILFTYYWAFPLILLTVIIFLTVWHLAFRVLLLWLFAIVLQD